MEASILYFKEPGRANTEATLRAARKRGEALGIRQIVVATTHGYTARKAAEIFAGMDVNIIAVSICAAFGDQGWSMSDAERADLEKRGITVLTSLHSLGDDINDAFGRMPPNRIVRETLYRFCQGMKVCVEIIAMAADAGLLPEGEQVVSCAGTGHGSDTVIAATSAASANLFELDIHRVLAMPLKR